MSAIRAVSMLVACLLRLAAPGVALAHDDPIVTIRILSAGITDGDVNAALGEVDENATILVDRPVVGRAQVQQWMEEQLRKNLRIDIVDIQPTQTSDGYAVTWTTRMYRQDWRLAGVPVRRTTEQSTIHNGRVTRWTSSLASELGAEASAAPPTAATAPSEPAAPPSGPPARIEIGGVPLSDIPIALMALPVIAVLIVAVSGARVIRRTRER